MTAYRYASESKAHHMHFEGDPRHREEATIVESSDPEVTRIFDRYYSRHELLPETLDRLVAAGLGDRMVNITTSDPHFTKDETVRVSDQWSIEGLQTFIATTQAKEQEAIAGQLEAAETADAIELSLATEDGKRITLKSNDTFLKWALHTDRENGVDLTESLQKLVDTGHGDTKFDFTTSEPGTRDQVSAIIAEMYGKPKPKTNTGTVSVHKVLESFVDTTGAYRFRKPNPEEMVMAAAIEFPNSDDGGSVRLTSKDPEVMAAFRDAQARGVLSHDAIREMIANGLGERECTWTLDNGNTGTITVAQMVSTFDERPPDRHEYFGIASKQVNERLRRERGKLGLSMKDWAAAVTAQARRNGFTGKPMSEQEAQFATDAYKLFEKYPDGERQFTELLRSFGPNPPETVGKCDFCNGDDPRWEYPCEDFALDTPNGEDYRSDGAWAACEKCAMAIENNDRISLVNRYLASKPRKFHDMIRPWGIRLHNQFFRHRTGSRHPAPNYAAQQRPPRQGEGGITVMSADHPDAPPEIAARVRETGDVAMMVEDEQGNLHVIAEGQDAVEGQIERRQITNGYMAHPLLERYLQHMSSQRQIHGIWTNQEAWHALAEKYAMTLSASATLGIASKEDSQGAMYFDSHLTNAWGNDPAMAEAMGLYITHGLHDSVPYLWTSKIDELANEPDLPPHNVTRGLAPHPSMFWSFESAFGEPNARIDWMLVMETSRGYEIWCPLADDEKRDGRIKLTGTVVPYGSRWPDIGQGQEFSLSEFLLKRLSFVNSKYTETPHVRAHRNVRRAVERDLKPYHHPMPDDLGAFVIHLRAPEPKPARAEVPGPGREINRQHCWWRRAHNRILYRDKPNERATWVRATLMGDTNLPLIRTTIVVDH